jgi:hypothetical protein
MPLQLLAKLVQMDSLPIVIVVWDVEEVKITIVNPFVVVLQIPAPLCISMLPWTNYD